MKKSVKIVAMLLAILFSLSVVACGTYNPANNGAGTGTGNGTGTGGGTTEPTPDEEGAFSDTAFTVSLRYKGELYILSFFHGSAFSVSWIVKELAGFSLSLNMPGYFFQKKLFL